MHTDLPSFSGAQKTLELRNLLRQRLRKNCLLALEYSSATSIPPTSSSFGHPGDNQAPRRGQFFSTCMLRKENMNQRPGDGRLVTAGLAAASQMHQGDGCTLLSAYCVPEFCKGGILQVRSKGWVTPRMSGVRSASPARSHNTCRENLDEPGPKPRPIQGYLHETALLLSDTIAHF